MIGLPLGPGRRDLPLDLAAAFASAYDLSVQRGSINYGDDPVPGPPLSEADADWVKNLTRARVAES